MSEARPPGVVLYLPRPVPQEVVVVESSHAGWNPRVSRRGALALPVVLGLVGCTQLPTNDPYIQVMSQDPMFSWKPPMGVFRAVSYKSQDFPNSGRGLKSNVNIAMTPRSSEAVPELRDAALYAMAQAGYSELVPGWVGKRYVSQVSGEDFWIECSIDPDESKILGWPTSSTYAMVNVMLSAPWAL